MNNSERRKVPENDLQNDLRNVPKNDMEDVHRNNLTLVNLMRMCSRSTGTCIELYKDVRERGRSMARASVHFCY